MRRLMLLMTAFLLSAGATVQPATAANNWCADNIPNYEECLACCDEGYVGPDEAPGRANCKANCDVHYEPPTMYCVWVNGVPYCWLW